MILLERYAYTQTHTESVITVGEFQCFALERPWLDNKPGRSCIPEGTYPTKVGRYHAGGYPCLELLDVPGRSLIKGHGANLVGQLQGCFAPGLSWGVMKGERAILQSRTALAELLNRVLQHDEIRVTFRNRFGPG